MAERGHPEQARGYEQNGQEPTNNGARLSQAEPTSNDNGTDSNRPSERKGTANRGFAAMDREKQRRIASEGGRAAHRQGVAHEWSRDEAREAGRKGGQIVSQNRDHMSEIGRRGGQSSGQRRQRNDAPNEGQRGEA